MKTNKQTITEFLLKYTDPKYQFSGISSEELAGMLEEELQPKKTAGAVKLGSVDGLVFEGMAFTDRAYARREEKKKREEMQKIDKEEMLSVEMKRLRKIASIEFYDRVDNDFSLSQDDELNL